MREIAAERLVLENPSADCANCGEEIDSDPEPKGVWVQHNGNYYCPSCAEDEGLY